MRPDAGAGEARPPAAAVASPAPALAVAAGSGAGAAAAERAAQRGQPELLFAAVVGAVVRAGGARAVAAVGARHSVHQLVMARRVPRAAAWEI